MNRPATEEDIVCYEIKILGVLQKGWLSWFNGNRIYWEEPYNEQLTSVFQVFVPDQAKLRGILNKIWDLNLTLLSVNRIDDEKVRNGKGGR